MPHWDLVIIGGGAAGLSSAAAAAGAGRSCLVIDRMGGGGELMNLGALQDVGGTQTGPDLAATLLEQAVAAGAELGISEATGLRRTSGGWQITTEDDTHTAAAVVLAVGLAPGTLGLDNEAVYEGRGLSHCAACDAPLYADRPVVVAGSDCWAIAEALELAQVASGVTLVTQDGAAPAVDGVRVITGRVTALSGDAGLDGVTVQPESGPSERLPAHGLFVQTGRRPALDFAPAGVARDATGRIVTDDACRTNLPGLFAAGDARADAPRTLTAAITDGRRAAAAALT